MQSIRKLNQALSLTVMCISAAAFAQANAADPGTAKPTDPQIAAIVVAANQVDIDAAKYAKAHARDKEVVAFADTMIRDHEAVNKQAKDLVKKLNITPEESASSRALKEDGKRSLANLKRLHGAAFDKAYIDQEVAYHQKVVDTINNELIPNATHPQLKMLLEKTAPIIQAHLDHAKSLQSKVGAGVGGAGGTEQPKE